MKYLLFALASFSIAVGWFSYLNADEPNLNTWLVGNGLGFLLLVGSLALQIGDLMKQRPQRKTNTPENARRMLEKSALYPPQK
jgi:hypothetical protein